MKLCVSLPAQTAIGRHAHSERANFRWSRRPKSRARISWQLPLSKDDYEHNRGCENPCFLGQPPGPGDGRVIWKAMGHPIHDNWWQTETGGIMIANFPSREIRPGSMGRPLPGIEAAIVQRVDKDTVEVVTEPGVQGDLALRPGWPSMFRNYLHEEERYWKCFLGGWYLTGDLATCMTYGYLR